MRPETRRECEEALRSAQELLAFLWNGITPNGEGGKVEITTDDATAPTLAALLTDSRALVANALDALELDRIPTPHVVGEHESHPDQLAGIMDAMKRGEGI